MGKRQPTGETVSMTTGRDPTDEWLEDFTKEEVRAIVADLKREGSG